MKNNGRNYTAYRVLIVFLLMFTVLIFTAYTRSENDSAVYTLSKIGSRGNEVRQIQKKLRELGYYKGGVDGIYGTNTQKAVKSFQKSCGITADGVAGPKTLKYLGLSSSADSVGAYSGSDINLLAKLIAAEARGESYKGQVAVAAVVLNRVASSEFPNTISGVIYQKNAFPNKNLRLGNRRTFC